jgi:signal transduction histidine kinase
LRITFTLSDCNYMKKKLNIAFALITLSLVAIIIFQFYWTVNAYRVNKSRFNADIDLAMQRAMDDCKKDYFDSIRLVLVKALSPPKVTFRLDTAKDDITENSLIAIQMYPGIFPRDTTHRQRSEILGSSYFTVKQSDLNFYRKKVSHPATIPELIAEMSFYNSFVMSRIQMFLMFGSMPISTTDAFGVKTYPDKQLMPIINPQKKPAVSLQKIFEAGLKGPTPASALQQLLAKASVKPVKILLPVKKDSSAAQKEYQRGFNDAKHAVMENDMYHYPPNYRQADSLKLTRYLVKELKIIGASSPFTLSINTHNSEVPFPSINPNYSQTSEYSYKYHGFRMFNIVTTPEFFVRATFKQMHYTVIRGMLVTLILSVLLVVLTFACFMYVVRVILQQKKLADLKDDFINNMTHELKTPIATITVAIEGLQKFNALNDAEKTQRYLQTSRSELNRLNDLVTKVLNIATFENKDVEMLKVPVNVDEVINEVIATEKAKAIKTVNISYLNKGTINLIYADKLHFRNIISNLLDNAIKYSGDVVDILVTSYQDGNMLCIAVKDNGIGIAPANINQVFDKFYRVPTGNVHNVKGTGLGLSYVKYIAQAHGGSVQVKSEINAGTEFIVCLPLTNG